VPAFCRYFIANARAAINIIITLNDVPIPQSITLAEIQTIENVSGITSKVQMFSKSPSVCDQPDI